MAKILIVIIFACSIAFTDNCNNFISVYKGGLWFELCSNPFKAIEDDQSILGLFITNNQTTIKSIPFKLEICEIDELISISTDTIDSPIFLFKNNAVFSAGNIYTAFLGDKFKNEISFNYLTSRLNYTDINDNLFSFYKDTLVSNNEETISLCVEYNGSKQKIICSNEKEISNSLFHIPNFGTDLDNGARLLWVGDIDNDELIDILLTVNVWENYQYALLLSSYSTGSNILGKCKN